MGWSSAHWAGLCLQIGNAHKPEKSLSYTKCLCTGKPAAAAASAQLWLKKCNRQACRIQNSSSIQLPEPILCSFATWATSCETGIQMTWKENLAALKSIIEVSFSSAEPGYHSWQLPSCCLYGTVFLLGLGWKEAVSPGIDSVTESRPREFISSKPLPLLISKGNLKTFLA